MSLRRSFTEKKLMWLVSFPYYTGSPCSDANHVPAILPAQPGELFRTVPLELLPPAEAPLPPLEVADIVAPPLPAVTNVNKASPAAPTQSPSGAWANVANPGLSLVAIMAFAMLFSSHWYS